MASFKALSRGTQIVLVAGPLLPSQSLLHVAERRGRLRAAGVATVPLDGFDAWGLLLALLVLSTLTLLVLRNFSDVEMSEDIPWEKVIFGLGAATAAVAVVKNLLDADRRGRATASSRSPLQWRVGTYSTGPRLNRNDSRCSPRSAAVSGQLLDEQGAVLARTVVVLRDPIDLEPERLVERERALIRGEVTQRTTVRPFARASSKKRSYSLRPRPSPRSSGVTPTKWMYASSSAVCERNPQTKPSSSPSLSSATKLVPSKWMKKSFGSMGAMSRPPHQTLIRPITRP